MWRLKIVLICNAVLSLGWGQSTFHAFGLGLSPVSTSTCALGISGTGLVPSFRPGLSLSNPVTWNQFQFATLAGVYSGLRVEQESAGIRNLKSNVDRIQFILPLGKKYGFGLGLRPYSDQQVSLQQGMDDVIFDEDTLTVSKELSGSGGITSFYTGLSFPITDQEQGGIEFDFLFGSSRLQNSLFLDGERFQSNIRRQYSGTVMTGYLSTTRFNLGKRNLTAYLMAGFSLSPLLVHSTKFQAYQDVNDNGYYDLYDSPDSLGAETKTFKDTYKPVKLGFGIDLELTPSLRLLSEFSSWNNSQTQGSRLSAFKDQVKATNRISLGIASFATDKPKNWYEWIHFRSGVYSQQYKFDVGNPVNEIGTSLGFGFKFGFPVNQIDIAFMVGERSVSGSGKEMIRKVSIGMNLTDLWFVKRRNRN